MSTCDTCRAPGACCSGLVLNRYFSTARWRDESAELMAKHDMPYLVPIRPVAAHFGENVTAVMFDCTRLGDDGRCGDYENRPELCRVYEPGSDRLCAEYVQVFHGIPIVTVNA